jgi:hypothetical protein
MEQIFYNFLEVRPAIKGGWEAHDHDLGAQYVIECPEGSLASVKK